MQYILLHLKSIKTKRCMPYQNTELHYKLTYWSKCLSIAVIVVGCLVILGWQFDIDVFKRPVPHLVAMNPLTAVLLILSGFTLLLTISSKEKEKRSVYLLPASILISSLGAIKLVSLFFHYKIPIDTFLYSSSLQQDIIGNFPNTMAPNTASNFLLTGLALILFNSANNRRPMIAQVIALTVLFLSLLSLLGYLYEVNSFYGLQKYIPMSVHTAITFFLLSIAMIFVYPEQGIMRNFTSTYAGSTSARLLIPAAIIIPASLGYIRLLGDWNGIYSKEFGVAILMLSIIITFFLLITYNASLLNKKDALRKEAEDNLKRTNADLEKQIEKRTKEIINNEKRFRSMIENSSDIISLTDENNNLIYINSAIESISGYNHNELKSFDRFYNLSAEDSQTANNNLDNVLKNPGVSIPVSLRIVHKNGKAIWLEGTMKNMLHDDSIHAIVSNYRDVTERKEAEIKAEESEKKIWNTLDKMMEGIQIIDRNWKYIYVNEAVAQQGKYTRNELLGHTMIEKYPGIENSELYKAISDCLIKKTPAFLENEFEYNNGTKGWFELSIQPVPEGVFILSIDITQRKAAQFEIKKMNEELEERVKERTLQLEVVNKELESFSYSISHDLRAPLRAVNGYAKMIEEDYEKVLDEEGKRLLNIVQSNAKKMGILIDDLLAFSRLGRKEIKKSEINVKELLEATLSELSKSFEHSAKIYTEELNNILADYTLISQVFFNLISNAVKYSSKKENPVVTIGSEIKENDVIYKISDNGAGFDMKYGHKLFGVFQRLHSAEEFEGTGVGLAIVQRIINKHGGRIWAEGKVDEGAIFYFSLPLKG